MAKPRTPLDLIADNPRMAILPACPYGAVWRFVSLWWRAGCPDLTPNFDYHRVTGLNLRDWIRHKTAIMAIIDEIAPKLALIHQKNEQTLQKRRNNVQKAWAVSQEWYRKARLQNVPDKAFITDSKTVHTPVSVIPPPPKSFNPGQHDHVSRAKALKSNESGKETLFKDK